MEIEAVKTWQWMLTGLIAGLLFSCVVAWSGPGFDTQPRDTIEQGEFENDCFIVTRYGQNNRSLAGLYTQYHKGLPFVRDVTVHPPIASDPKHFWVTGRVYSLGLKPVDPTKAGGPAKVFEEWKLFKYQAAIPYEPGYTRRAEKNLDRNTESAKNLELASLKNALGGASSFPTVVQYLKAVRSLPGNNFTFNYAWWELPRAMWSLPPLAGFLMIGVAWPLTLSTLQTLGLAKRTQFNTKAKTAVKKPSRPASTAMPAGVVLHPVAPEAPPKPVEHKEYGGEFYPVVKVTHKE
jgi:hypothetical protein